MREITLKCGQIHFVEVCKMDICISSLEDICDIEKESGLGIETPVQLYILTQQGLKEIEKVLGISGRVLRKMKKSDLKIVLNKCRLAASKKIVLRIENNKVIGAETGK